MKQYFCLVVDPLFRVTHECQADHVEYKLCKLKFIDMDTIKINVSLAKIAHDVWKLRVGRKGGTDTQSETNVSNTTNVK